MNKAVFSAVARNRNIVATLLGFAAFTLVLHAAWLATIVYAFREGGTAEAGIVTLALLVPAALVSPLVAVWFDRFAPRPALVGGFGLQAVALLLIAATVSTEFSKYLVYGLLGLFTVAQMSSRPTVSTILPRLVDDPTVLTAANSATGAVETIGLVAGPSLAGLLLLLTGSPAVTFSVCAAAMALAALAGLAVHAEPRNVDLAPANENIWAQVVIGARLLGSEPAPRQVVLVMAAMRLVVGVLEVGVVIIAIDHLGRTEASAGALGTAIGVGAGVGSALTVKLVGRRRLSQPILVGVVLASLPVAAIALSDSFWVVAALLAIAGLGRPIVDVAGRTLLQGLSSDDVLAQVFGILQGLSMLMLAIGSALFSGLAVAIGINAALLITGCIPFLIVALLFSRLRRIDADRPETDPHLLALIKSTPLFAPLAAFRIEQMAQNMHRQVWMPRQTIFCEGDYGEVLYVVDSGWVHVDLADAVGLRRGGLFGEIAVLRTQPRMATVTAGSEGAVTYRIHRDAFLDAVATAPTSVRRGRRIVSERLGEA